MKVSVREEVREIERKKCEAIVTGGAGRSLLR